MTTPILRPQILNQPQGGANPKGLVLTLVEDMRRDWKTMRTDMVATIVGDNLGGAVKTFLRDRMRRRGL